MEKRRPRHCRPARGEKSRVRARAVRCPFTPQQKCRTTIKSAVAAAVAVSLRAAQVELRHRRANSTIRELSRRSPKREMTLYTARVQRERASARGPPDSRSAREHGATSDKLRLTLFVVCPTSSAQRQRRRASSAHSLAVALTGGGSDKTAAETRNRALSFRVRQNGARAYLQRRGHLVAKRSDTSCCGGQHVS